MKNFEIMWQNEMKKCYWTTFSKLLANNCIKLLQITICKEKHFLIAPQ